MKKYFIYKTDIDLKPSTRLGVRLLWRHYVAGLILLLRLLKTNSFRGIHITADKSLRLLASQGVRYCAS